MATKEVGLSTQIRSMARAGFVHPAVCSGRKSFSISVRELMDKAQESGMDVTQRVPPFCTSIQKRAFLEENGLEILGVEGPPSGKSTTVVVHYKVVDPSKVRGRRSDPVVESPSERAHRLTEKLRGLLKDELAEYGGAEGFVRWIRSEGDKDPA